MLLLERRPPLSPREPGDVDTVLSDVLDTQRERRILLVDESANVSCMYTL